MPKIMGQRTYCQKGGTCCPVCKGDAISGGPIEVDAGGTSQPITCDDCGATWTDTYKLTGYSELNVPTPDAKAA